MIEAANRTETSTENMELYLGLNTAYIPLLSMSNTDC